MKLTSTRVKQLTVLATLSVLIVGSQACQPTTQKAASIDVPAVDTPVPTATPAPDTSLQTCPTNYVQVPASTDFGVSDFCVAKYEAKQVNSLPESAPEGVPWTNLTRDAAAAACSAKGAGYALLDNNHWMTIARNIESVDWNFGGDASIQEWGVSRGVTNNNGTLPLPASSDDNDSCHLATVSNGGAPAVCDLNTYDTARRVHKLSNGSYLWDFAGNASEWISDNMTATYNVHSWILNITDVTVKGLFGPSGTDPTGPANPTGNIFMDNFGYLSATLAPPYVIFRGGGFNYGRYAGIYTAYFTPTTQSSPDIGFRCYFQPTTH